MARRQKLPPRTPEPPFNAAMLTFPSIAPSLARHTRPVPSHGNEITSSGYYYFLNQRWWAPQATLELEREANKLRHAVMLAEKEGQRMGSWQEVMKGDAWSQSFSRFQDLPVELKVQIIRIAVKEAIAERVSGMLWKYDAFYLRDQYSRYPESGIYLYARQEAGCSEEQRDVEVMKRHELLSPECLGGLLGTSKLFRVETIRWVEARRMRGWKWERGVTVRFENGPRKKREIERSEKMGELEKRDVDCKELGFEGEVRAKRKDVRRWLASVYGIGMVWNEETSRIGVLD